MGSRRIHRFQPILTNDLIIDGNAIDGLVAYDRKKINLRWRLHIKDGVEAGGQLVGDTLYLVRAMDSSMRFALKTGLFNGRTRCEPRAFHSPLSKMAGSILSPVTMSPMPLILPTVNFFGFTLVETPQTYQFVAEVDRMSLVTPYL